MPNSKAALYIRTSKEHIGGNSIDSQRKMLHDFATTRGLEVVAEYVDAATSGGGIKRQGLLDMYSDLCAADRAWDTLLVVDTARLARNVGIATAIRLAAKTHGVSILYSLFKDAQPNDVFLTVLHITDQIALEQCEIKCTGGVEVSLEQGYRGGGRAPRGYRLVNIRTGRITMGAPETKTRLEPNDDAEVIGQYLKGRAAGRRRIDLKTELKLHYTQSSLIDIEWNALTYAGHTVWNRHNPHIKGEGYKGGVKHRSLGEWKIIKNTHPALITEDEAERILAYLYATEYSVYSGRKESGNYLLAGFLTTSTGRNWQSDGHGFYRVHTDDGGKARSLKMQELEEMIFDWVAKDIVAKEFGSEVHTRLDRSARKRSDASRGLLIRVLQLHAESARNAAVKMLGGDRSEYPELQMLDHLQSPAKVTDRPGEMLVSLQSQATLDEELNAASEAEMQALMARISRQLSSRADNSQVKLLLSSLIEKIVLDPGMLACEIHYLAGVVKRHAIEGGRRSHRPAA